MINPKDIESMELGKPNENLPKELIEEFTDGKGDE